MKNALTTRRTWSPMVIRFVLAALFVPAALVIAPAQEAWQASVVATCGRSPGYISCIAGNGQMLLAASTFCGPLVSADGGRSWGPHPAGPLYDSASREPVAMHSVALWNDIVWASFGDRGVFIYRDGTWMHVPGIPQPVIVRVLERDTATGVIYAGTQASGLFAFVSARSVFERRPDVRLFEPVTVNTMANTRRGFMMGTSHDGLVVVGADSLPYQTDNRGFPFDPISTHAIVESNDGWQVSNTLPFAVAGGMYVRGPGSDVWRLFNDGIDKYLAFAFDVVATGRHFVLSTGYKAALGVYTWAPPQLVWTPWNQGLTDLEVSALAVVEGDNDERHIVAGTRSGLLFVRPAPTLNTSVHTDAPGHAVKGRCITKADVLAMGHDAVMFDLQGRQLDANALPTGVAVVVTGDVRALVYITD